MNSEKLNLKTPSDFEWADQENIPINGFQQILEMLRVADPSFRESLLRRLAAKDRELAVSLKRRLF